MSILAHLLLIVSFTTPLNAQKRVSKKENLYRPVAKHTSFSSKPKYGSDISNRTSELSEKIKFISSRFSYSKTTHKPPFISFFSFQILNAKLFEIKDRKLRYGKGCFGKVFLSSRIALVGIESLNGVKKIQTPGMAVDLVFNLTKTEKDIGIKFQWNVNSVSQYSSVGLVFGLD
jgi:hypothetical protein